MIDNMGMYQGYSVEGSAELKLTPDSKQTETCPQTMTCAPIYECPQERCIHKQIIHEVPHIQPINTRIINPCYTCTEENEVCNVNTCGPMFM